MALRFIDGFEHYAIPSQIPLKYTSYNDSGGSSGITTMRLDGVQDPRRYYSGFRAILSV